jgi:hypothetical protein
MSILVPTVTVEMDKPRTMRMDYNALVAIKKRTGVNILGGGFDVSDPELQVVLIWALLRAEDPSLTEEQVGSMLHLGNIAAVSAKATELMSSAFAPASTGDAPAAEVAEAADPLPAAA